MPCSVCHERIKAFHHTVEENGETFHLKCSSERKRRGPEPSSAPPPAQP